MFQSGLRLKRLEILGLLALLLQSHLSFGSDFDAPPPQVLTDEKTRRSSQLPDFVEPLQDIEGIFSNDLGDDRQLVPSRLFDRPQRLRSRRLPSSFLRVNYDVPPGPSELVGSPPAEANEQPQYLMDAPVPAVQDVYVPPCEMCDPVLGGVVSQSCCPEVENWSPIAHWFGLGRDPNGNYCSDVGIGHERVVFAPFEIDPSQPTNFTMVRWDSGFGLQTPNRSEYFMSGPGKGPALSPNSMNFQDLRFVNETGSDAFSVQTEIPVRFIEPVTGSTSGLGDMKVATKARLINGKKWQITQIFRTYIPTGVSTKGVGTGHVSLEPGVLSRYEISPSTYVHGEVKFLIPIAADPGFASNVLTYGVGVSHVFYETNNFAIIPDFEMVNYNFLGGQKTVNGIAVNAAGDTAVNLIPGARFVVGPKGDLGLFEFGISNMIGVGVDRYVNDLLRLDFKFVY